MIKNFCIVRREDDDNIIETKLNITIANFFSLSLSLTLISLGFLGVYFAMWGEGWVKLPFPFI